MPVSKSCLQTSCTVRYLMVLGQWRSKVLKDVGHSVSNCAAR